MLVRQLTDPSLAQFSYLVGCPRTGEAIVIDPERDIDRYIDEAARHHLRLVAAVDTHIHADYLSGLKALAERGVTVYASAEGGADWQYEWLRGSTLPHRLLRHGDRFTVGNIEFEAVHTPGHTPEHLSYLVRDGGVGASDPIAMASGDFVFVGDVGRPDLLERAAGLAGVMAPSARDQYASIGRAFRTLPEYVQVWPAHGAGSACGKSLGDVPVSTVGYELRHNPSILAATGEQAFVDFILAGQPEPPRYFARMKYQNRSGPPALQDLPRPAMVAVDEVAAFVGRLDVAVLDTRGRSVFAAGHLPGALLVEWDYQFCAIAGSYVEPEMPIVLVVDADRAEAAVRGLIRIGLDRIVGIITTDVLATYAQRGGVLETLEGIDCVEMEARRLAGQGLVVDVRSTDEHAAGHVPAAIHIPHTRLVDRLGELPAGVALIVHCRSGARAAAAAALLRRAGRQVTAVQDAIDRYPGTLVTDSGR